MKSKKLLVAVIASAMISLAPLPSSLAAQEVISTDQVGLVYNLEENDVLKQLSRLAGKGANEDGWDYILETKELVDHGKDTRPTKYWEDFSVILNRNPKPKEVIDYHIHPTNTPSMPISFPQEALKEFKGLQPPSSNDISVWHTKYNLFKEHGIRVKEFRVVEAKGYWSVNLENSNMKELGRTDFYTKYDLITGEHIYNFLNNYWQNKGNGMAEHIQNFLIASFEKSARRLGLDIEFHPF